MTTNSPHILIADDDEGDRKQIRRALMRSALAGTCTEVASIEEALEACQQQSFDCALVDYRMPGRDGLSGIAEMHALYPHMAIAMLTGEGDERVAAEAIKSGAADYLPKALVHPHSLERIIENSMEKMRLRRLVTAQREELETFAKILVHDLKAPLNSIRGFATLIDESVREGELDRIGANCQRVLGAARRMSALIETLYQYTRLDGAVRFERVDMTRVVEDALTNLAQTIQERGARITHDALPVVRGNAAQLTQLFQNLIGNAIKYCQAETPAIHISARPQEAGTWQFSVQDNGIGIPEDSIDLIFEPFRRLHGVGEYEGTGLGLATCRKIVERHGGTISCQSVEHEGTCFVFTLHDRTEGASERRHALAS